MRKITAFMLFLICLMLNGCAAVPTPEQMLPSGTPELTESAADPSTAPTDGTPTPDPTADPTAVTATPYPALDLTGLMIVTAYGGFEIRPAVDPVPGNAAIASEVLVELDKPENEGALFRVRIVHDKLFHFPEGCFDNWLEAEHTQSESIIQELEGDPIFAEFNEEFHEWFYNVYFDDCPYKGSCPYEEDCWQDPDMLLTDTLYNPNYSYYEQFFTYLHESSQDEKVDMYRPKAEEYWHAQSDLRYAVPPEALENSLKDYERLYESGLLIDLSEFNSIDCRLGCIAYLTKEQILNFPAEMEYAYYICFPHSISVG